MLREIQNVKQERGSGWRRWFESDELELIVWFAADGDVVGFQLCYDLGQDNYALTWRPHSGFAHSAIDTGDESPLVNRTPILVPDGSVPWNELCRRFEEQSRELDPVLRQLIQERLREPGG